MRTNLPATYQRLLLQIACEAGATSEQVLEGTGLDAEILNLPDTRVRSSQAARMVSNVVKITGNEGIGLECGLRAQPTLHGFLGYAVMSCATLQEAMQLAMRFIHLRQRDVALKISMEGEEAVLETTETHDLGTARHTFYEGLLVGLARVFGAMVGQDLLKCELWFDWSEPSYYAEYRHRLPKVRYSMPSNQLRIPMNELKRRLVMADPSAAQQAIAQVEREQALSGRDPDQLIERVHAELTLGTQGYPDLASVAGKLFMSSRTLKRKLQQHDTGFNELLEESRHRDAMRLLTNPDLNIQQVAAILGYKDPPSFTRAFKRWAQSTPTQARAKVRMNQKSR